MSSFLLVKRLELYFNFNIYFRDGLFQYFKEMSTKIQTILYYNVIKRL